MERRRAAIALVALAMFGAACTGGGKEEASGVVDDQEEPTPVGPQTYTVDVDLASPDGQNLQASVYSPLKVKVRPGDTVVFENRSSQAPHTVTFGVEFGKPEAPSPVTKGGLANPLVFEPCFMAAAPAAGAEACSEPVPAAKPAYAGTGFWHSGALALATAPGERHKTTLTVAPEIPVGNYTYGCLLHPRMQGLLEVVELDEDRDMPARVTRRLREQRSALLNAAENHKEPTFAPTDGPMVAAGWGTHATGFNRFSPASITVKTGETVTWKAMNRDEPHTVTFESPFRTAEDPGVFTAGGAKAGSRYAGGFAHSGLIGPQPFPTETFSLTFTKPGTYSYVCVLHRGMAGQVIVTG